MSTPTCPTCNGAPATPFCAQCGTRRPPEMTEREEVAYRLYCAQCAAQMAVFKPTSWNDMFTDSKRLWLVIADEAIKWATERPATSSDPASVPDLNAIVGTWRVEWSRCGLDDNNQCLDLAQRVYQSAIAHCGSEAARLRAELDGARNEMRLAHESAAAVTIQRDEQRPRAEVAQLKAELTAIKEAQDRWRKRSRAMIDSGHMPEDTHRQMCAEAEEACVQSIILENEVARLKAALGKGCCNHCGTPTFDGCKECGWKGTGMAQLEILLAPPKPDAGLPKVGEQVDVVPEKRGADEWMRTSVSKVIELAGQPGHYGFEVLGRFGLFLPQDEVAEGKFQTWRRVAPPASKEPTK